MLGLAKRTNSKIMQASTSEIYGDPEVHPQNESYKGAVSIDGPKRVMMRVRDVRRLFFGIIKDNIMLMSR